MHCLDVTALDIPVILTWVHKTTLHANYRCENRFLQHSVYWNMDGKLKRKKITEVLLGAKEVYMVGPHYPSMK